MSSVKRFAELFIPIGSRVFSIYTRIFLPISMSSISIVSTLQPFQDRGIVFTVYGFTVVLSLMYIVKILERALRSLTLPFMFIALGLLVNFISMFLGLTPPPIYSLILSAFKVSLIFISIALLIQWLSFREFRCVLKMIRLSSLAKILTIVMAVMPTLFNNYAESYTAVFLKLGRRRVYKAVKPLVVQSAILALDIAQALYLYGFPRDVCISIDRPKAKEIALIVAIIFIGIVLLLYMP
ncbi:MAG: hypothetical protein QXH73_00680 [Ignisphaera sp.]